MEDSTIPQEAAAVEKSPLYKPLRELTEDDIAQVTREDCRRFLKEKGMRRPSWNKSQAIQQVISLKALLEVSREDGEDDDDENNNAGRASSSMKRQRKTDDASREEAHNPPLPPPPPPPPLSDRPALAPPPPPPLQQQQKDVTEQTRDLPSLPMTSRETACVSTRDVSDPAMTTASAAGLMTVFYDGKVNVYDGVPPEKAFMIMQLAASQSDYDGLPSSLVDLNQSFILPQLNPIQNITVHPPPPPPPPPTMVTKTQAKVSMTSIRIPEYPQAAETKNLQELELEGPACRKALLQRYLEKRKDRRTLTCKKNMERFSSSDVDFHLDQNFRYQTTDGQHYQSDIISPHPMPPSTPTRCPRNLNS